MRSLEEEDRALDVLAVTRAATEQALSGGDGPMGPKHDTGAFCQTCGGSGMIAYPASSPGPPEGEMCPDCPHGDDDSQMAQKHITTDATIADDLRASLKARGGVPAGHTWADFKLAMIMLGVTDTDTIASIEYGCGKTASGILVREDAPDGIEIRETR